MIDIHSHILPQLDDGARTLEEALDMARLAADDGIQQMVCTPHMFNGLSHNPEPAEVLDRVGALQEAIAREGLRLLPGNEVHFTHEILDKVRTGGITKINQLNYMLVEFPALSVPAGATEMFQELLANGVRPILVHPERNAQLQTRRSMVVDLVQQGVYVQVTAMSLTGEFGTAARNCAESLLRHNCVHFVATDTHRSERRPPILSRGRDAAAEIIGSSGARKLVFDNPLAVVTGGEIKSDPPTPYSVSPRGKASFFGKLFGR
jgi:protein-tyrosine phosphatase